MKEHLLISIRFTLVMAVMTCGIYPLAVLAIGQLAFPRQANGSFVRRDGKIVGSELIGQPFVSSRFFHPRPSASGYDATASGGTNLGPTSLRLRDGVAAAVRAWGPGGNVPADAVTSSGSGLDPHISPENARAQAVRVARENALPVAVVQGFVDRRIESPLFGVFGAPRVNVLLLNLDVEAAARSRTPGR